MKSLTITYLDGTTAEVRPSPGDIVRFERHFDIPASSLDESARLEHIMFLAWTALKRTGQESREFEEFLDVVGDADSGKAAPLPPPS